MTIPDYKQIKYMGPAWRDRKTEAKHQQPHNKRCYHRNISKKNCPGQLFYISICRESPIFPFYTLYTNVFSIRNDCIHSFELLY